PEPTPTPEPAPEPTPIPVSTPSSEIMPVTEHLDKKDIIKATSKAKGRLLVTSESDILPLIESNSDGETLVSSDEIYQKKKFKKTIKKKLSTLEQCNVSNTHQNMGL
ncbi:MAG: hypothetical protein KAU26_00480, partial [Methylococcales bacterium]|nr:hypothetical protein [Methylococcales bacterium]